LVIIDIIIVILAPQWCFKFIRVTMMLPSGISFEILSDSRENGHA